MPYKSLRPETVTDGTQTTDSNGVPLWTLDATQDFICYFDSGDYSQQIDIITDSIAGSGVLTYSMSTDRINWSVVKNDSDVNIDITIDNTTGTSYIEDHRPIRSAWRKFELAPGTISAGTIIIKVSPL